MIQKTAVVLFKENAIRRAWYKNEWWFVKELGKSVITCDNQLQLQKSK